MDTEERSRPLTVLKFPVEKLRFPRQVDSSGVQGHKVGGFDFNNRSLDRLSNRSSPRLLSPALAKSSSSVKDLEPRLGKVESIFVERLVEEMVVGLSKLRLKKETTLATEDIHPGLYATCREISKKSLLLWKILGQGRGRFLKALLLFKGHKNHQKLLLALK